MTARCIVRGNTKKAWLFFGLLVALSAIALLFDHLKWSKPLASQIVLLLSLVGAAYILIRYITAAYHYEITEEGEEGEKTFFLYIIRLQGKRGVTQAKLALSSLTAIASKKPDGYKAAVLNFSPILLAEDDVFLAFLPETEKALVRIHADEAFRKALFACAPDAKDHLDAPIAEQKAQKPHGMYDISDIEPPKEGQQKDTED